MYTQKVETNLAEEISDNNCSDDDNDTIIKRKKQPHDPVSTTRKINKIKRMHGEEYLGFSRTITKK